MTAPPLVLRLCLVVALLACSRHGSLVAQGVRGVLQDSAGVPVPNTRVTLLDTATAALRSAITDSAGSFVLRTDRGGSYRVRVERTGYMPYTSDVVNLNDGDDVVVIVRVVFVADAIPLDPLQVSAPSAPELPLLVPSINAKRTSVITAGDVRAGPQTNAYDLVHSLRSHWLRGRGPGSLLNNAAVAVVVDGVRMRERGAEALRQIPAASVESMQYLDSLEAPMYFGMAAPNGAILIATRKK